MRSNGESWGKCGTSLGLGVGRVRSRPSGTALLRKKPSTMTAALIEDSDVMLDQIIKINARKLLIRRLVDRRILSLAGGTSATSIPVQRDGAVSARRN